jgi:hypothetical protein
MRLPLRTHILLVGLLWSALLLAIPPAANAGTIFGAPTYVGLNSGLVGFWTFNGRDMAVRTAYDMSGHGNYGYLTDTTDNLTYPLPALGKIGQGLSFDGVDDHIDIESNMGVNGSGITLAAWVKPGSLSNDFRIISKSFGTQTSGHIWMLGNCSAAGCAGTNDLRARIEISGTTETFISSTLHFEQDVWQFVAVTYDGDVVRFFKNGISEVQDVTNGTVSTDSAHNVYIGANHDGGEAAGNLLTGSLDEVRVYERALSVDELKRLYKIGSTLKYGAPNSTGSLSSGLVGWWTMDGKDIAGVTALDRSGQGNNGALTNGPTKAIGKIGQGLLLDEDFNQYVNQTTNLLDYNAPYTISAWFKADSFPSVGTLFNFGDVDISRSFDILQFDGSGVLYVAAENNTTGGVGIGSTLSSGTWYHVVMVRTDASTLKTYLNGNQDAQEIQDITGRAAVDNITVGRTDINAFTGEELDGFIDDVRVYNRALNADEVKRLYKMGSTLKQGVASSNGSLSSGLVGHWTFDGKDIAGVTAYDRSGQGNNGTLGNIETFTNIPVRTIGKIGQALNFNGSTYVDLANPTSLNNISRKTISAWIYPRRISAAADVGRILDKNHGATAGWLFFICNAGDEGGVCEAGETNRVAFNRNFSGASGTWISSNNNAITLNAWQHVAITYDDSSVTNDPILYVNGTPIEITERRTPAGSADNESGNALWLGNRNGLDGGFDGVIDDVRIYDRLLSGDEIKRLYNIGR